MFKTLIATAMVIGWCGAASAAPLAAPSLGAQARDHVGLIHNVRKDGKRHGRSHWRGRGGKHWRGNRAWRGHRHGPPGWRRYNSRPYGWRNRGCMMIGPVWFCP